MATMGKSLLLGLLSATFSHEAAATEVKEQLRQGRFLKELHTSRLCGEDNGPGDRRNATCAVDRCKGCWGLGAELSYDSVSNYTTCVYHPPQSGVPFRSFCGEGFVDTTGSAASIEQCQCCYPGGRLSYDRSSADGIGYTFCSRRTQVAAAEVVKLHFRKARFVEQLHASSLCDDDNGRGDRRNATCAVDRCKGCWGLGAELSYDGVSNYTTCVYHPPQSGVRFRLFCGEGFVDTTGSAASIEQCQCCYPGGRLSYDRWSADGIGYTYCQRR